MLKNVHIGVIFVFLSLLGIAIGKNWAIAILLPLLITSLIGLLGSINIRYSFYLKSICRIDTSEKIVFLSFDDGPDPQNTYTILNILREKSIPAIFFCIGKNAKKYPELFQRIHSEGHLIGNHTHNHNWRYLFYGLKKVQYEIECCSQEIEKLIGKRPILFRPPFGFTNPILASVIKGLGMISIGWNIRSFDTQAKNHNKLIHKIVAGLKPGGIILLHDRLEITAEILPELIEETQRNGYKILALQDRLKTKVYT